MSQQTAGITYHTRHLDHRPRRQQPPLRGEAHVGARNGQGPIRWFGGTLRVADNFGGRQLHVDASSVDTHNKQRDKDLRSAKFFDVDRYREIGFELASVNENQSGLQFGGYLLVRESRLRIDLEVDANENGDRLVLRATTPISREADPAWPGTGWG